MGQGIAKTLDTDITALLQQWQGGDGEALQQLLSRIYHPLQVVARKAMQGERVDHTLQPTALVHEAFVRLSESASIHFRDSQHFFAVAAGMMRRILVDHARRLKAARRGGENFKVTLSGQGHFEATTDLLALNEALEHLAAVDSRKAKVIELRFFGGLSVKEIAAILDVSEQTVILDTRLGKAYLFRKMQESTRA